MNADLGLSRWARKQTLAVLKGIAVVFPLLKMFDKRGYVGDAGLPAPVGTLQGAADTGTTNKAAGDYLISIAFYDEFNDIEGPPIAAVSVNLGAPGEIDVDITGITNLTSHPFVTHVRYYVSAVGGSILYRAETIPIGTTTFTDDNSDATVTKCTVTVLSGLGFSPLPSWTTM
jgi:hypothetical protein